MPSSRPCAAFEPISPDFNFSELVETTPNFEWVVRIHCDMIEHQGLENFQKLVLIHVILGGRPLVIEGYHERLDRWTFALQWLRDNLASKVENARDLTKKTNVPLSIGHYLNHMALLTNQWSDKNYKDPKRQRMYLKDIDCPQLWHDKMQELMPLGLFYLNESTGDIGGLGAVDEQDPNGPGTRMGRGAARAGDLMSSLPKEMRAENLMCYIGHEGTYTPAHREMCASLGQNIMVEASTGGIEDGKSSKLGSSIWFMTETKEREVVSEYWLSRLGHDIEVENHFAQINAWKAAPFKTYVVDQRIGDFILIPPLAPHQVWNRGTRTMKVAWNRTTVETLEMALDEALPRARMVCRDEQYKNKAIIYYTLQKYSKLLKIAAKHRQRHSGFGQRNLRDVKVRQLEKDFRRLQALYTKILVSETFFLQQAEKKVELIPFDGNITCSYCRCNIFNRFLTCPSCVGELDDGEKDTYDICMECYAMGRSCACISKLKWVEQFPWNELTQKHEQWRLQILQAETQVTEKTPKSLKMELERQGKKRTLAQICQLELIKRPFRDISKPVPAVEGVERTEEIAVDDNGNLKKKRKVKRTEKFLREHAPCHVDIHWEPKWKQAQCSTCDKSYCYGVLFRAYDVMPQDIMADPSWQCPSCLNICSCRSCRNKPGYKSFTPSGTMLGHNTKAVADPRSVESLVDFSFSNISWIQKAGDDHAVDTHRLNKRKRAAEEAQAKEPALGDHYVDQESSQNDNLEQNILLLARQEGIPIDPALTSTELPHAEENESLDTEDEYDENPEEVRRISQYLYGGLLQPQPIVPDGGVLRDVEHAYDQTEAITYDYPDPDLNIPLPEEQIEKRGNYESVLPPSPDKIEMVDRKRKRTKVHDSDRPYGFKKGIAHEVKPRKSLIVKFAISKEKLGGMNEMAVIAQKALSVAEEPTAPVISSDLQALNSAWNVPEAQPPAKKARIEQISIDEDDDFTPSRRRDRKGSGIITSERPEPEADMARRSTRMQAVTYEEPSDEDQEFDELPERPARSKLALMETVDTNSESDLNEDATYDIDDEDVVDKSINEEESSIDISPPLAGESGKRMPDSLDGTLDSILSQPPPIPHFSLNGSTTQSYKNKAEAAEQQPRFLKIIPGQKKITQPSMIDLASAQANRKAKTAAMEWAENSDESFDAYESPVEESDDSDAVEVPVEPSQGTTSRSTNIDRALVVSVPQAKLIPTTVVKASANDWQDSESSEDEGRHHLRGPSLPQVPFWNSANRGKRAGLKSVSTSGRGRPRGSGRGRGRPRNVTH